jgi:hypothetical protein
MTSPESKNAMNKHLTLAGLAAAIGLLAAPAMAQSADLRDWTALGDAVISAGSASLSTAFGDESPASGSGALDYIAFEPALGLAYDSLGAGDTWDGSALQHSFTAAANTRVSFDWRLSTLNFDAGFADRAFVVIDGSVLALGTVAAGAVVGSFSHTFASAGQHALAFGVVDVGDVVGVSSLTVSGLAVSAVPEPSAVLLLLAGLGTLAALARQRRTQSPR